MILIGGSYSHPHHSDMEKQCAKCNIEKSMESFSLKSKTGKSYSYCKDCECIRSRERYKNNPQQQLNYHIKRKYGLSPEEYNILFISQNGRCKICRSDKKLSVDHCHSTGKVRGLLCTSCNILLGGAKDSIKILEEAIEYLRKS